ncbi:hypothetical protein O3P69_000265 [Scylla paramamosain]|uniref:G-protein coupled receptors family 1 profile domain-containing protein n=1 Tax=Scylla paramamosain TaxID=85552 RepID=A0AAW0UWK2_SCYPA
MTNCSTIFKQFTDSATQFFLHYAVASCFLGLLCNAVVLWCVVGCPRTRPSVKVLLCALFSTTLLMCLLRLSLYAYFLLWCDDNSIHLFYNLLSIIGVILTVMELLYIFVIAFLRTMAVWSTQRHQVKLRTSMALVVGVALYVIAIGGVAVAVSSFHVEDIFISEIVIRIILVLQIFPASGSHPRLLLLYDIRDSLSSQVIRNKRRLAATQDTAATGKVMDQATRALLAVFISNLLFIVPHMTNFSAFRNVHVDSIPDSLTQFISYCFAVCFLGLLCALCLREAYVYGGSRKWVHLGEFSGPQGEGLEEGLRGRQKIGWKGNTTTL